ncbi:uncharacterized protein J3R85_006374 [Psidium guajava]|nr:uncharacterized protein J3R85_006374 [Psidium guajava]
MVPTCQTWPAEHSEESLFIFLFRKIPRFVKTGPP